MVDELKIVDINKLKIFFLVREKNHKIKVVSNIDARDWVKFGHSVTSISVKNRQKLKKKVLFGSFVIADKNRVLVITEKNGALVKAPFF